MDKERRKYLRLKEKMGYEGKGRDWFDFECEDHNDVHMEIGNWKLEWKQAKPKAKKCVTVWLWTETDCGFFVYLKKERWRTRGRFQVSTRSANHESESEPEP